MRYVVEDLNATVLVALGAVLGLGIGVLATIQLTSGTPYSSSDLNRAAASTLATRDPGETRTVDTSALDGDIAALQDKVTDLRDLLTSEREASKKQQEHLDVLEEKLDRIKAKRAALKAQVTEFQESPTTAVTGTLTTTSTYTLDQKPWPATCGGVASGFLVKVGADGGSTYLAELDGGEVTKRTEKDDTLTIGCRFGYTVQLPKPYAESYDFTAVATADGKALDSGTATAEQVEQGDGPALSGS